MDFSKLIKNCCMKISKIEALKRKEIMIRFCLFVILICVYTAISSIDTNDQCFSMISQ